jgi:hypothetical protein
MFYILLCVEFLLLVHVMLYYLLIVIWRQELGKCICLEVSVLSNVRAWSEVKR